MLCRLPRVTKDIAESLRSFPGDSAGVVRDVEKIDFCLKTHQDRGALQYVAWLQQQEWGSGGCVELMRSVRLGEASGRIQLTVTACPDKGVRAQGGRQVN